MEVVQYMANEKSFANMEKSQRKRKNSKKDDRDGKNDKGHKRAKHNHGERSGKGGNKNLWALFKNVPDNEDCSKHGKVHNAGSCYHNPYKKKGGSN
eukprot:13154220-Ditylum_brightwellii.AAC.1